ncbi:hypothetical protein [Pseudoxanthomonas sp. PXM02]|uniref:hypothetical protein n=1 Tax=Pseudoxanthomonas sp. PXM02 TaxID=2769294 RepID=UPI00177BF202|nr:hypothetical protein [Pseudoxanthomonas sp. PXM02]MBD9481013.1 hypothetical protein [Pseudoxanthomonas sp. PXM02]
MDIQVALDEIAREITESNGGAFELLLVSETKESRDITRVNEVVRRWAEMAKHELRNPLQPWNFSFHDRISAKALLTRMLSRDLVFNCEAMNPHHAARVAEHILSLLQIESVYSERFVAADADFSEVVIISDPRDSIVVAVTGDD